jgi:Rieske Fe-S protein
MTTGHIWSIRACNTAFDRLRVNRQLSKTGTMIMRTKSVLLAIVIGTYSTFAADVGENWTKHCGSCHGKTGKGDTKAGKKADVKDLTDSKYQAGFTDDQMFKQIKEGMKDKNGKEKMKPFSGTPFRRRNQSPRRLCSRLEKVIKSTRRIFLDFFVGTSIVAWFASVSYPVVRFLKPLRRSGAVGPTRLTREEVAKLEKDRFVIVPVSGKRVLVLQTGQQLIALDAKCTHEGCTVQFLNAESVIWCACHNARFDLDGRVLAGPPPRPLPKYVVERQEDGGILIATEGRESG